MEVVSTPPVAKKNTGGAFLTESALRLTFGRGLKHQRTGIRFLILFSVAARLSHDDSDLLDTEHSIVAVAEVAALCRHIVRIDAREEK